MRCVGSVSADDVDTPTATPARTVANRYLNFMMLLLVTGYLGVFSTHDGYASDGDYCNDPFLPTTRVLPEAAL
jgi:hypothetical protein